MRTQLAKLASAAAERGLDDHFLLTACRHVVRQRLTAENGLSAADRADLLRRWHTAPVALPKPSNKTPAEFFENLLGGRLMYSPCLWDEAASDLDEAQEAMLALSAERAGIENGMRVLDLGSGWGAMSLYLAQRFPDAEIVALSNSQAHGDHIRKRAAGKGLSNVTHVRGDVNDLALEGFGAAFDSVVLIEGGEFVRNYRVLLDRLVELSTSGATAFIQVFSHVEQWWEFEDRGPGDWVARDFATTEVLPSHHLFRRLVASHEVEESWWLDAAHHRKTLDAWLAKLDRSKRAAATALGPVFGDDTEQLIQQWRLFLMGCSEFFAFDGSELLGVSQHRVRLAR